MDPLWADLINSDWHDALGSGRREDRLGNDAWLTSFLARTGWQGERLPGSAERERLAKLRAVLRRVVDASLARRSVPQEDIAALNQILARGSWLRRLERQKNGWEIATVSRARGLRRVGCRRVWHDPS